MYIYTYTFVYISNCMIFNVYKQLWKPLTVFSESQADDNPTRDLPYVRPTVCMAYVRAYPHKIWPNMAVYGTNVPPF